jgi:hypothetical protein
MKKTTNIQEIKERYIVNMIKGSIQLNHKLLVNYVWLWVSGIFGIISLLDLIREFSLLKYFFTVFWIAFFINYSIDVKKIVKNIYCMGKIKLTFVK